MHPTIEVLGLELRSYALVATLGIVLCWALLLPRMRSLGYRTSHALAWVVLAFPIGALSARVGAALAGSDGLTVLGSIAGCVAFSLTYWPLVARRSGWEPLDAVAFTFPLSLGIGRLGCLLHGCCEGIATDALPILTAPLDAFAPGTEAAAVHRGLPGDTPILLLPLLFTGAYALELAIVELVYRRRLRLRLPPGGVMMIAIVLDALVRVPLEPLRAGPVGVSPWMMGSAALGAIALGALVGRALWQQRRVDSGRPDGGTSVT